MSGEKIPTEQNKNEIEMLMSSADVAIYEQFLYVLCLRYDYTGTISYISKAHSSGYGYMIGSESVYRSPTNTYLIFNDLI